MNAIHKEKKKVVARNGWQVRIYRFVYKSEPNFNGYCPFFWATIFALLISPLVLCASIFDGTVKLLGELVPEKTPKRFSTDGDGFVYHCPIKEEFPPTESSIHRLTVRELEEYYPKWFDANKDQVLVIKQEIADRYLKEEQKQQRIKERQDKIVRYAKHLVLPILIGTAAFFAYWIYRFVAYTVSIFSLADVGVALGFIGGLIATYLTIVFVGGKIGNALLTVKKVRTLVEPPQPVRPKTINPVIAFFGALFTFVIDTIQIIYYRKCPLLVFDEVSQPITKNEINNPSENV